MWRHLGTLEEIEMALENLIQFTCFNERKQQIDVYLNPEFIVSATPTDHPELGKVLVIDTIKGTFVASIAARPQA